MKTEKIGMERRQALQEVILTFLKKTYDDALDKVHADGHKVWAISVLLAELGDADLVDWTVSEMRYHPVGPFPYQTRYQVAIAGASEATFEELLPSFVKEGRWSRAVACAQRAGRKLSADEVRAIGKAYTDGASRSDPDLNGIRQLFRGTLGEDGVAEFDKMDAAQKERFSDPY
jgi:hypothetical protein